MQNASSDTPGAATPSATGDYAIAFEQCTGFLRATVTGPNTVETIQRYSREVREACVRFARFNVLVVVDLHGPRLSMLEVYKAIAAGSDASIGLGLRVAYVDLAPTTSMENMQIAESVATTRGIPVRTFTEVAEAEKWLLAGTSR